MAQSPIPKVPGVKPLSNDHDPPATPDPGFYGYFDALGVNSCLPINLKSATSFWAGASQIQSQNCLARVDCTLLQRAGLTSMTLYWFLRLML